MTNRFLCLGFPCVRCTANRAGGVRLAVAAAAGIWFWAGQLASAEQPLTLDQIRRHVEPSGNVRNIEWERQGGCQTVHAFAWSLELAKPDQTGGFAPTDVKQEFHHGERFRVRIESGTDLYIYVLVHNSDGSEAVLVPACADQVPLVHPKQVTYLPATGAFKFTPPEGCERFRLLASPRVLPWVMAPELFQLQHGDQLPREQEEALAQLRSIRTREIESAIQRQGKMKHVARARDAVKGLGAEAGTRGLEVVAAETANQSQLVLYASPAPHADAVIVEEITLKHVK